jgi:dTDP-4-dehydrorhamnose reductase
MIAPPSRILLTGGTGRLGRELQVLLSGVVAPSRAELDVTQPEMIEAALKRFEPEVLVHAAAYTDVAAAEQNREACWQINVAGTRRIVQAAVNFGVFLVHISTDYVFEGTRGMYKEEDPPGPVLNYYALSKLVAEELVRLAPRHLLIRTSFRPREWPHPVAFTDVYTSQDYVDIIAPEVALAIQHHREIPHSTLHIATERKSAYELARRRRPDVRPGNKREANVALPDDISLDTSRWQTLKGQWGGAGKS